MTETLFSDNATRDNWLKKTLFRCKRGNLETELLLTHYAPIAATSGAEQRAQFEALLQESDAQLFCWLLPEQSSSPSAVPQRFQALIRQIRNNHLISNQ